MPSNKKLIIIDFDETLYKKDSLIEFCKYIYINRPSQIWAFFVQLYGSVLYLLRLIDTKKYKEYFLFYLHGIPESQVKSYAQKFWNTTNRNLFNEKITALFEQKDSRIICISASPELYLKPIMEEFKIEFIGTKIDFVHNKYLIIGENCKGIEKVNRLRTYLMEENLNIYQSYSDSMTDLPLFELSENAFLVKKNGEVLLITS